MLNWRLSAFAKIHCWKKIYKKNLVPKKKKIFGNTRSDMDIFKRLWYKVDQKVLEICENYDVMHELTAKATSTILQSTDHHSPRISALVPDSGFDWSTMTGICNRKTLNVLLQFY